MRNAFIKAVTEVAAEDERVWLLCGDLGYSVLEPFAARYPDRFLNIGVAEQNMAGVAAGIALSGYTVYIYSIGNFPTLRCLEQIRNDICYHGADVKVVSVGAGYAYGSQGYTHHALEDVAIMSTLPGIEVFSPCDPVEVVAATRTIAASRKPAYLRLSRAGEPTLHRGEIADIRRPTVLRQGRDVIVLASGPIVSVCLEAAEALAADGFDVAVASVPCLKPLDDTALRTLVAGATLVVTVEEHILRGGLHSLVASARAGERVQPPLLGLGISEQSGNISSGGDRETLLAQAGLTAAGIASRVKAALHHA